MFTDDETMFKNRYLPLLVSGVVNQIDYDAGQIRLLNGEEIVNIEMIQEDIKNLYVSQEITLTIIIEPDYLDNKTVSFKGYISKEIYDFVNQFTNYDRGGFHIGFKTAKSIYNYLTNKGYSRKEICFELANGNYDLIRNIPGMGPNITMKLIDAIKIDGIATFEKEVKPTAINNSIHQEAFETLKSLGFMPNEISEALNKLYLSDNIAPMDVVQKVIAELQK